VSVPVVTARAASAVVRTVEIAVMSAPIMGRETMPARRVLREAEEVRDVAVFLDTEVRLRAGEVVFAA
jgi:hypothetical protein